MAALPGSHYCKDHQGNESHYSKGNCQLCRLVAAAERVVETSKDLYWADSPGHCDAIDALAKALGE